MSERLSVDARTRSWRGVFLGLFICACIAKFVIACFLSPFGDEAFYAQESLAPAWGYSDLPPLTAWLIALSTGIVGHGLLAMRLPFLLLGACVPWQVGAIARRYGGESAGWQAATFAQLLPLVGSLGVLALPDVPLTFAILLAAQGLIAALETNRKCHWLLLGAGLAMAWATHYRAAMPMLAGLLFLLATPRGRAQWQRPGLWMAMGVAALGLVPMLAYNLQAKGAGLAFQLVERNPWQFHADAFVQPVEQAVACTPVVYLVMLWALWRSWRRRGEAPFDVIAMLAGTFVLVYFVAGLFADDIRFRAHWPLPAYAFLCAVLPILLKDAGPAWRRVAGAGFILAGIGLLSGLAYLGLAASPAGVVHLAHLKVFPARFTGWRDVSEATRDALASHPDSVLVADNFMLAAELRFALHNAKPVFSLDNPLNVKHGRAPQLAAWGLDEAGLAGRAGAAVLLVVDETALHERDRRAWLGTVCSRVDITGTLARRDVFDGRRRFALYTGRVRATRGAAMAVDDCVVWTQAYASARTFGRD